jgi:hypothetical protein
LQFAIGAVHMTPPDELEDEDPLPELLVEAVPDEAVEPLEPEEDPCAVLLPFDPVEAPVVLPPPLAPPPAPEWLAPLLPHADVTRASAAATRNPEPR